MFVVYLKTNKIMENYRLVIEHLKGDISQRINDIKNACDDLPPVDYLCQATRKTELEEVERLIKLYEKDFVNNNKLV
jgi:hypothetical protein